MKQEQHEESDLTSDTPMLILSQCLGQVAEYDLFSICEQEVFLSIQIILATGQ